MLLLSLFAAVIVVVVAVAAAVMNVYFCFGCYLPASAAVAIAVDVASIVETTGLKN